MLRKLHGQQGQAGYFGDKNIIYQAEYLIYDWSQELENGRGCSNVPHFGSVCAVVRVEICFKGSFLDFSHPGRTETLWLLAYSPLNLMNFLIKMSVL
jgi:hypothetical protein